MEDKLLILECKNGSKEALCGIYEKYKDYLLILALALLNDKSSVEDVLHDVFVSFAQGIDDFKLNGSLRAYLAVCIVNRARNRNRLKQQQTVRLDKAEILSSGAVEPSRSIICNEELKQLSDAMSQLSYQQREVIMLHLQGGITFEKIADLEDISVNTIKSRYRYGVEKLRSVLNREVRK